MTDSKVCKSQGNDSITLSNTARPEQVEGFCEWPTGPGPWEGPRVTAGAGAPCRRLRAVGQGALPGSDRRTHSTEAHVFLSRCWAEPRPPPARQSGRPRVAEVCPQGPSPVKVDQTRIWVSGDPDRLLCSPLPALMHLRFPEALGTGHRVLGVEGLRPHFRGGGRLAQGLVPTQG